MGFIGKAQTMGMAALILAASTLLSRFMGLIRDKIISWQFGAGCEADMYFAAFVVPDIINHLLACGFMSITLIPMLSRRLAEDEADAWRFYSCVITWMALAALVFTGVGMAFAPQLAHLAAPGLDPGLYARLAFFMRLVLPAQIFFLVGSCLTALVYYRRQFAIPALAPLVYNGCIMFFGVLLPSLGLCVGMTGFCVGVSIGAFFGTFFLPLRVARAGGLPYAPRLRHPLMKSFLLLLLPLMIGQTVAAMDEQFLRIFGSLVGDGVVSLLNYAKRVTQVPVALVGQAAALASYPFLVSLLTKGDREGFMDTLGKALRSGMGIMVPCVVWMLFLSDSTFTLLFYGGRMTHADMQAAVPLLRILLASAPFWFVYALLVRGFYAQTDTLTPAVSGAILTVLFLPVYYFVGVPLGARGIAATSAVSMACYVAVLVAIWVRREGRQAFAGLAGVALRSGLCAVPGCLLGWQVDRWLREALPVSPILSSLAGLAAAGIVFLVVFLPLSVRVCPGVLDPLLRRLPVVGRFFRRREQ